MTIFSMIFIHYNWITRLIELITLLRHDIYFSRFPQKHRPIFMPIYRFIGGDGCIYIVSSTSFSR